MSPSKHVIPVKIGLTTAYIVKSEGVILVDTGFPGSEEKILASLQEQGVAPGDVRLILLTHGHADHAGSAAALKEATGALVAAGHPEVGRLRTGRSGKLKATGLCGRIFGLYYCREAKSRYPPLEPDILIDSEYDLHVHGVHGIVIPTPGHTAGSLSVILDSGDVLVGDLIFGSFPMGKPAIPFFGEDLPAWSRSIYALLEKSPKMVYIAHGGPFEGEEIKRRLPFRK
ncbi:MAG TPA: MBL fold metallo-hydrolase [Methanoregulaceae archaeon]|nr:MBL fold metallo-hydrolase [Methanoregulaceae archaeon]